MRLHNEKVRDAIAEQMAYKAEQAEGQALPQVIQDFTPFAEVPEVAAIFKSLDACQKAASIAIAVKASVGLVLELLPIPSCVTAKYFTYPGLSPVWTERRATYHPTDIYIYIFIFSCSLPLVTGKAEHPKE